MATYNWSIIAGANLITRPVGGAYCAPWGNDVTGNGSRQLPFKTISKSIAIAGGNSFIYIATGVYRETLTPGSTGINLYGDGNVTVDITLVGTSFAPNNTFGTVRNMTFTGGNLFVTNGNILSIYNCTFKNMDLASSSFITSNVVGCVFNGGTLRFTPGSFKGFSNNTFYKCNVLFGSAPVAYSTINSIFYQCNVSFKTVASYIDWCIFYQCNFRFNATDLLGATYYPAVPTGYTYISTIGALQSANATFGATAPNFNYSLITDPLFNNLPIFDFTLDPASPAKNLSYFGSYIGAYSIASKLLVRATASASSFDNAGAVNLTIADDSLTLTSTSSIASIETKPVANLLGRQYSRLPAIAINADRNGQFLNSTLNLSASTLSAGLVPINTPYVVEVGSITYNGTVYNIGDRFTSSSSSLSFTTSFSGVIREILQAPSREAVEARFNDGSAATITNAGTITTGTWYYVVSGTATYNGNSYVTGDFIKGVGGFASFTGTGILRPTFASGDAYFLFELNQPVTTNNIGNVITGAISKGNGSSDFDRTAINVFSVNLKFIQLKYTIQVANLTS